MNLQDVCDLMERFEDSKLLEMQLEMEGVKLVCKKDNTVSGVISNTKVQPVVTEATPITKETDLKYEKNDNTEGYEIKAKIAGTFYRAESPESKPFIQVGDKVKEGDVIGMIEAMKMMNSICSPIDGTVVEIKALNEELIGFDDVIAVIKTV